MKKLLLLMTLFITGSSLVYAQKNISGSVTNNKDGTPLPGVSVLIKGTNTATQTDGRGNYTLSGVPNNATLVFSFVGFKSQEAKLNAGNSLDVQLSEDSRQLTEVIVTANAIKREAKSLGYATSTINNADLTKGKDRSVLNSLQGKDDPSQQTESMGGFLPITAFC